MQPALLSRCWLRMLLALMDFKNSYADYLLANRHDGEQSRVKGIKSLQP